MGRKSSTTPVTERVEQAEKVLAQAPAATAGLDGTLAEEIQAFLARREELTQRLVAEIAATEQRLAALRQSAALLGAEPAAERKTKKPAKKSKRIKVDAEPEGTMTSQEPAAVAE
jgi:hypothetical protein